MRRSAHFRQRRRGCAISGPAVLGHLAAPGAKVANRIARRVFYRQRVWWRVNRRSPIKIHCRAYTRWLKSIDRATFDLPPEQAERDLLQVVLAADPPLARWGADSTDEAVFLINDTWKALLGLATDADVRERNETWARVRRDAASAQLTNAAPIVSPFAVETLSRRSQARTAVRLGAFALSAAQIAEVAASINATLPIVPPGRIHVLAGTFGSGKSELAERWHRESIRALTLDWASAPFAVWLSARAIDRSLDLAVADWTGRSEQAARRGADIVIDGLDETDTARAVELLEAARVFVAGSPRSRVLITSRDTLGADINESSHPSKLTYEAVEHIISVVTGQRRLIHSLPTSVRDAVRTPFFAVAAGSVVRNGGSVGGTARIIDELVELALRRPLDAGVATSPTLAPLLKRLAVQSTNSGSGVLRRNLVRGEVDRALKTRLVTEDGERLSFSLPIFQQWFAAQALIEGGTTVDALTATVFDRWRWSFALAASVASPTVTDKLLTSLTRSNPAVAAWTVSNAMSNFRDPGLGDVAEYVRDAAPRLAALYREVRGGLGDLGTRLFPTDARGDLATMGVRTSERGVAMSWKVESTGEPVVVLPPDLHPFSPDANWNGFRSAAARAESCWLWTFAFDDVASALGRMLISDRLPADSPVWRAEQLYSTCRSIVDTRNLAHPPIAVGDLLAKIDPLLERHVVQVTLNRGRTLSNDDLVRLRANLLAVTSGQVTRPWPTPDIVGSPRGGMWATTWFASFGWALGVLADTRIGFLGTVQFPEREDHPMPVPHLTHLILPVEVLDEYVPTSSHLGAVGSPVRIGITNDDPWPGFDSDAAMDGLRRWVAKHGNPVFGAFTSGNGILDVYNDRPATRLAIRWLESDLKSFGLKVNLRVPDWW